MRGLIAALIAAGSLVVTAEQPGAPADLATVLTQVGDRVREYYARARTIMCRETVQLQPLGVNWLSDGHVRRLEYELRVAWEPDGSGYGEASVVRQIQTVDGRAPREKDEPGCMDPKPVSPEPLAMLLPARSRESEFTLAGKSRVDGRQALRIDYKSISNSPAEVKWHDECVSVELPGGRTRGRIWVDEASKDVLRLDEQLVGLFEFRIPRDHVRPGAPLSMIIDRADSSIRYRAVAFHDPDEVLMVPVSIDSLTIVRNSGTPRLRTQQVFSNYQRFVTGGRIVEEAR